MSLTKQDIKAIRQSDRVSLRSIRDRHTIECLKEVRDHGPFEDRDRRYEIECSGYVLAYDPTGKSPSWGTYVCKEAACYELLHSTSPEYSPWAAVAALVREGDDLRLCWCADGSNQYQQGEYSRSSCPIHFDTITLQIVRSGTTKYTIPLGYSHCPDNSARMIRGYTLPVEVETAAS